MVHAGSAFVVGMHLSRTWMSGSFASIIDFMGWNARMHRQDLSVKFKILTIFSLRCKLSPTCTLKWQGRSYVLITCNTLGAHHMQHVMSHMVRKDRSTINFDRVEIAFILTLFYWLTPLTNEGGEETGIPGENPWTSFRKCHKLKPENSSPNQDSNPHSSIGGRLGKQTC